ncbi:MAG: flavodoxin domain-containing protein [Opitutales bacterium]
MNIKVIYGSETGNAETLANNTNDALKSAGFNAEVCDMDNTSVEALAASDVVVAITSTWGDGEAPSNAIELHSQLENTSADLSSVKFAVMGIGMSSFDQFCKAAIDFDAFLEKAKATRILDIELCDDDYDDKYPTWIENLISALKA